MPGGRKPTYFCYRAAVPYEAYRGGIMSPQHESPNTTNLNNSFRANGVTLSHDVDAQPIPGSGDGWLPGIKRVRMARFERWLHEAGYSVRATPDGRYVGTVQR